MNFSKVLGNPIVLTSLKTVCEMAIAIELTIPANHGHDKPASSPSQLIISHVIIVIIRIINRSRMVIKNPVLITLTRTSHTTAQCYLTKNANNKNVSLPSGNPNKSSPSAAPANPSLVVALSVVLQIIYRMINHVRNIINQNLLMLPSYLILLLEVLILLLHLLSQLCLSLLLIGLFLFHYLKIHRVLVFI